MHFSKAFDSDYKMKALGITERVNARINSFPRGRSFSLRFGGYRTASAEIPGGFPYGSPLTPTLFPIFTNYLAGRTHDSCNQFANAVKVEGIDLEEDSEAVRI